MPEGAGLGRRSWTSRSWTTRRSRLRDLELLDPFAGAGALEALLEAARRRARPARQRSKGAGGICDASRSRSWTAVGLMKATCPPGSSMTSAVRAGLHDPLDARLLRGQAGVAVLELRLPQLDGARHVVERQRRGGPARRRRGP